jgi:hypothetical protein
MTIRRAGRPDLLILHLRNSALTGVSKSSIMVRPAQGPETAPAPALSC